MALNVPVFFTRLGSAIVFAAVMMTGFLWQNSNLPFAILIAIILVLCLREYFKLANIISGTPKNSGLEVATVIASVAFFGLYYFSAGGTGRPLWPVALFIPVTLVLWGALSPKSEWQQSLHVTGALFYILLPCILLLALRQMHWMIPLALLLMIWMNDTMAYLVGSFIGKTPFSKISPKKTWEGTGGGAAFTIALAAVWGYFNKDYKVIDWMVLAAVAAVAGTAGDLLESKLKRMAGVKDSGTIMPGHGGALDRFDSLLVATPFAFAYAYWFMA